MSRLAMLLFAVSAPLVAQNPINGVCTVGCDAVTGPECYANCVAGAQAALPPGIPVGPDTVAQCQTTCAAIGPDNMCARNCRATANADVDACIASCQGTSSYSPADLCDRNCEQSFASGLRTITFNTAVKGIEVDYTRRNRLGQEVRTLEFGTVGECKSYCHSQANGVTPASVELSRNLASPSGTTDPTVAMRQDPKLPHVNAETPPVTISTRLGPSQDGFRFRPGTPVTNCGGRPNCVDESTFHPTEEQAIAAKRMADELKSYYNALPAE